MDRFRFSRTTGRTLRRSRNPRKEAVRKHLGLESRYELMAVLAIGHPRETGIKTGRKNLEELILKKFG